MTFPQTGPTQPFPAPPVAAQPVKPRKMVRRRTALIVGAGVFFAGVAIGSAGGKQPAPQPVAQAEPVPAVTVTVTETKTVEPVAPATTQPAPPPAPARNAAPMISTGVWEVGVDFPAGTYTTTSDDPLCYYDAKTGSSFNDQQIGAGRWKVKLRNGQTFTSKSCGVWQKVG